MVGSFRQKQNDNEKNERGEHGRRGESQPAEQGLRGGGGGAVCDGGGRDLTPYVWMSERKLLMGLIMDDTIG